MEVRTRRLWLYRKRYTNKEGYSYLITSGMINYEKAYDTDLRPITSFDVPDDKLGEVFLKVMKYSGLEGEIICEIDNIIEGK